MDNPSTTLVLLEEQRRHQINFGARTAPGDQVFVQVVGHEGIYVVDGTVLAQLPAAAADWRDATLLDWRKFAFDELVVTNAAGVMRFQRETNNTWRIREPLKTAADGERIEDALEKLRTLRIAQFISDDPRTDLESFGLQPAAFELAFRSGTNVLAWLRFGRSTTNLPPQLYALRENSLVVVPAEPLAPWREHFFYFRDRRLFPLPAEFTEVEVRTAHPFVLQRAANSWRIAGEKFAVDPALVDKFLSTLGAIEIPSPGGFVKDAAIAGDFARYGLTQAVLQVAFKLSPPPGATNAPVRQIAFGIVPGSTNGLVYARRDGEDSIFAARLSDFQQLPTASWQLREPRVWNFNGSDVARIVARQEGKSREFIRSATNSWALGPGTQGVVDADGLDLIAQQFGELRATAWVARGEAARDPQFGFGTNNFALTLELKSGARFEIQFGGVSPAKYPYALVTLEGEPWVFEFSTALHQFMLAYLGNPKS